MGPNRLYTGLNNMYSTVCWDRNKSGGETCVKGCFSFMCRKLRERKKQQPIAEGAPNQTIGKLKKAKRLTQSKNVYELAKFGILKKKKIMIFSQAHTSSIDVLFYSSTVT